MALIRSGLMIVPLVAAVPTMAQVREVLTVGALDGNPAYVFGEIQDLAVDDAGNIYVLDGQERNVRVFGPNGSHKQTVGRPGSGPGEYRAPKAVLVHHDSLLVLDPANLRITTYTIGDSLLYAGDSRIPFPAYDFCMVADRLFVLGHHEDRFVHELRLPDLEQTRSFGEPTADHPMVRSTEYRYLDCARDVLVPYGSEWGRLAAYSPDGESRWELTVTDFRQMVITPRPDGGVRYSYPESGWYHSMLGTIYLGDTLVVQVGRVEREQRISPRDAPNVTWVGFTTGGRELWRRRVPFRVVVKRGRMLYGIYAEPFPRVIVGRM